MWRNIVTLQNRLFINQTSQCLKKSTSLSSSSSSSSPVSLIQKAPYCVAKRRFQGEFKEVTAKQSEVSLSFAKHLLLNETNKAKNVVVSPLSIQVVLSLIAAGSKGNTLRQLLYFLKANSIDDLNFFASRLSDVVFADGGDCLSFANSIWLDQSLILKPSFKQIVDSHYKATLSQVDFRKEPAQVAQQINSWAEKNTNGLIKDLVQEASFDIFDRLVFINALYFKGTWLEKFDSSKTKDYEFYLGTDGNSTKAPFMTSKKKQLIKVCDGFKVLGLPYKFKKHCFTMYIFLPDVNNGLPSLVEKIGSQSNFLEQNLPKDLVKVGDLRIPKFKISYEVKASNLLKELGLTLPFFDGELTEIVDSIKGELLHVSEILQKACIEVNEEGTEAAAVTAAIFGCALNFKPPPQIDFVADHPFLFLIREDVTGAMLFVGQVINPLEAKSL